MMKLLFIGTGGFAGACCRYLATGWVNRVLERPWFPYGTMAVNLMGCLLIGFINGLIETKQILSPEIRLLILTGFLGSFTTFSTFGFETFNLIKAGQFFHTFANLIVSITVGLLAVWAGNTLARII